MASRNLAVIFASVLLGCISVSPAFAENQEAPAHLKRGHHPLQVCRENPDGEACQLAKEKRRAKWQERKAHCRDNPDDQKCIEGKERRQERRAKMKAFCQENPSAEKCQQRKEKRQQFCEDHPDAPKCRRHEKD